MRYLDLSTRPRRKRMGGPSTDGERINGCEIAARGNIRLSVRRSHPLSGFIRFVNSPAACPSLHRTSPPAPASADLSRNATQTPAGAHPSPR